MIILNNKKDNTNSIRDLNKIDYIKWINGIGVKLSDKVNQIPL